VAEGADGSADDGPGVPWEVLRRFITAPRLRGTGARARTSPQITVTRKNAPQARNTGSLKLLALAESDPLPSTIPATLDLASGAESAAPLLIGREDRLTG
jgi:hypothetical protein